MSSNHRGDSALARGLGLRVDMAMATAVVLLCYAIILFLPRPAEGVGR